MGQRILTHANLHHHCTLVAVETLADKPTGDVLARPAAADIRRQTAFVDIYAERHIIIITILFTKLKMVNVTHRLLRVM